MVVVVRRLHLYAAHRRKMSDVCPTGFVIFVVGSRSAFPRFSTRRSRRHRREPSSPRPWRATGNENTRGTLSAHSPLFLPRDIYWQLFCTRLAPPCRVYRSRDRLERIANSISRHFNRPGVSLIKSSLSRFPAIYIYIFRFLSGHGFYLAGRDAIGIARVIVPRDGSMVIADARNLEEDVVR